MTRIEEERSLLSGPEVVRVKVSGRGRRRAVAGRGETGIVHGTEIGTGTGIGTGIGLVDGAVVVAAPGVVMEEEVAAVEAGVAANGTTAAMPTEVTVLTLLQVEIGRWQREWDFDEHSYRACLLSCDLKERLRRTWWTGYRMMDDDFLPNIYDLSL